MGKLKRFFSFHPETPFGIRVIAGLALASAVVFAIFILLVSLAVYVFVYDDPPATDFTDAQKMQGAIAVIFLGAGALVLSSVVWLATFYGLAKLKKWGLYLVGALAVLTIIQGTAQIGDERVVGLGGIGVGVGYLVLLWMHRKKFVH